MAGVRAWSKRGRPHRYVGSGNRRTIEQRRRLARKALEILGDGARDRLHGLYDGRQIGRDRRNARHGAAWSHGALAVVLMLGVLGDGVAGIGGMHRMLIRLLRMMLVRGRMLRLGILVPVHGGNRPGLVQET